MSEDNKSSEEQPIKPPPRPKRGAGSTPPPRPRRDSGSPPPLSKRGSGSLFVSGVHADSGSALGTGRSKQLLVFGCVGILGVALIAGLSSLLGLGGPSSTTAADYNSNEVREIIRLLREDPECRDTRLGGYFSLHNNSLQLWQRVLGNPAAISGREDNPAWTYTTRDGAVTIHVGVDFHSGEIPFVTAYSSGSASIGVNSNVSVDSESLKATIIGIKRRVDPGDSLAFHHQLQEKWKRDEADRQVQLAEKARQSEIERAREDDKRQLQEDRVAAEKESWNLRDKMPLGPERNLFVAQSEDWITRRAQVISESRKKSAIAGNAKSETHLRIPNPPEIIDLLAAAASDEPFPVVASTKRATESTVRHEPDGTRTASTAPKEETTEASQTITPQQGPQSLPTEVKTREQRIAELTEQALNQPVTLSAPYPTIEKNAPTDRISVQYAVQEIARQTGFQYDFETSKKNTDPICRRYVTPTIRNQKCRDALESILRPVGLTYRISEGKIVLERR